LRASRSFSTSASRVSVSCSRSWCSRIVSIILSRSSSICTINCSKFPSSLENCELRWLMLSSAIVGITSHIIFHILRVVRRHSVLVILVKIILFFFSLSLFPHPHRIYEIIIGDAHIARTRTHTHTHTARARAVQRYARCRVTCTRKNDTPHTRANQTHAHAHAHAHTQVDKVRKRKSVGIPLVRALLWTRTDISLFPIALISFSRAFPSSFSRPRVCLSSHSSSPPDQLLDRSTRFLSSRAFIPYDSNATSARSRCICFTDDGGSRTFSSLTACVSRLDYTCYIKSCDSQSRRKKKREGQARAISQIQRLSFILSVPFFFPSFLS